MVYVICLKPQSLRYSTCFFFFILLSDLSESHAEEALLQQPLRVSEQERGEVHVCTWKPPHVRRHVPCFFVCLCISFRQDNPLTIQTAQHRWNCLHCSCCFLLLLLWRGSALHTCLPSGLYQVNSHPSQQRRWLLWGCHSTIIHSFTVCSGAYSFHKCFFVLVCTCVCVCLLLPAWNGGRRMAQICECLRLTLVSRLKALAEDIHIPLRKFNMYTLTVTGKLACFIQTARAPGTVVGFICAADCKRHNKEHSYFFYQALYWMSCRLFRPRFPLLLSAPGSDRDATRGRERFRQSQRSLKRHCPLLGNKRRFRTFQSSWKEAPQLN